MNRAQQTEKTALGDAMRDSGADVNRARLYVLAADALRAAANKFEATERFVERLVEEGGALAALLPRKDIRAPASAYLDEVARDMKNQKAAPAPAVAASEGAGAHKPSGRQPSPSSPPSVPARGPAQLAAIRPLLSRSRSLYDTYIAIAGRSVGDLRYADLVRLSAIGPRNVTVVTQLRDLGKPHDLKLQVKDYVALPDLQRILESAP